MASPATPFNLCFISILFRVTPEIYTSCIPKQTEACLSPLSSNHGDFIYCCSWKPWSDSQGHAATKCQRADSHWPRDFLSALAKSTRHEARRSRIRAQHCLSLGVQNLEKFPANRRLDEKLHYKLEDVVQMWGFGAAAGCLNAPLTSNLCESLSK